MYNKILLFLLVCFVDSMRLSRFYSISRGNSFNNMTLRHFNHSRSINKYD